MASLLLGNLGSSLLGPIGGFIGSAIGSYIDNWLFAPKPEDIEGPRIKDRSTVAADPGVPIPLVWGADRLPGIVVHTTELIETKHKKKVGGKGGPPKQTQITYTYHVDIDFMLSEGPILGVGRIWGDGKIVRGTRYSMDLDTDENFEKLGGIDYPDWYKVNSYHPATVFWSYNPTYNTGITDTGTTYVFDKTDQAFYETGTPEAAPTEADPVHVTYHYDETREQYLPTPDSHDYTGGKIKAQEPPEAKYWSYAFPDLDKNSSLYSHGDTIDVSLYASSELEENTGVFTHNIGAGSKQWIGNIDLRSIIDPDIIGTDISASEVAAEDYAEIGNIRLTSFTNVYDSRPGDRVSTNGAYMAQREADGDNPGSPGHTENVSENWLQVKNNGSDPPATVIEQELSIIYGLPLVEMSMQMTWLSQGAVMSNFLEIEWYEEQDPPDYRDWPDYYNFYDAINDWSKIAVLAFWGVDGVAMYRGTEDQISDPTMELVDSPVPAYINRAHIVFQRLELENYGNRIPNFTFEVVQYDDARITDIIDYMMDRAEVDPANYDASALPTTGVESHILGYSVTNITNFRSALEPILEAFEVDAAEIGNQIVFRLKRRNYDHIIMYDDVAAIESGDDPDIPIKLVFRDVLEMPRKLSVRFKDPEREYQPNLAIFTRQIGLSVQESTMELPIVGAPGAIKRFTRDKMRDLWLEKETGSWTLPHKYIYVSPSDLVLIDTTGHTGVTDFVMKVTTVTRGADGILELEGIVRESSIYVPAEGENDNTGMDNYWTPGSQTNVLSHTVWEVMDIPALRAADDTEEMYWVACGVTDNWHGAGLYWSPDEDTAYDVIDVAYIDAVIGRVNNAALIDPVENCQVIDYDSIIEVRLYNPDDDLSSITLDQLLAGDNPCLVGQEIICFKDATDMGDGVWQLSTLLRGRRDTEDHTAGHSFAETFVLLDANTLRPVSDVPPDSVPYFKGVTLGGIAADEEAEQVSFNNERKRPFRPYGVTGTDSAGDIVITWIRQDRMNIDGWTDTQSDDTIAYQVAFYEDIDSIGSYRAALGVTDETFTYTAAMITADGYTSGDEFYVAVAQASPITGAGNTTRVKITCP